MKRGALALLTLIVVGSVHAACPPEGQTRESLLALRNANWLVDDATQREALAFGLVACLADPDPTLRDEVGFEALQHWMRAGQLTPAAVKRIGEQLLDRVAPVAMDVDPVGVTAPFAALALAEVARVDRLTPIYSAAQRRTFVQRAAAYMANVHDYRGFDAKVGWRHGVAHAADWVLQLSLNPALDKAQLDLLLSAVAVQVLTRTDHSYVYGEGQRLMAPVFYIAQRGLHDAAFWTDWFARITSAAALPEGQAFTTAALARAHNAREFIWPLYASVQETLDAAQRDRLLPGLKTALKALP